MVSVIFRRLGALSIFFITFSLAFGISNSAQAYVRIYSEMDPHGGFLYMYPDQNNRVQVQFCPDPAYLTNCKLLKDIDGREADANGYSIEEVKQVSKFFKTNAGHELTKEFGSFVLSVVVQIVLFEVSMKVATKIGSGIKNVFVGGWRLLKRGAVGTVEGVVNITKRLFGKAPPVAVVEVQVPAAATAASATTTTTTASNLAINEAANSGVTGFWAKYGRLISTSVDVSLFVGLPAYDFYKDATKGEGSYLNLRTMSDFFNPQMIYDSGWYIVTYQGRLNSVGYVIMEVLDAMRTNREPTVRF